MSEVYEIADRYVLAYAALDPIAATDAGIAGHDHELTDYSPDAGAARDRLDRDTLAALAARAAEPTTATASPPSVMTERLAARGRAARRRRGAARRCGSSAARCRRSGSCFDLMALRHRARLGGRGRNA